MQRRAFINKAIGISVLSFAIQPVITYAKNKKWDGDIVTVTGNVSPAQTGIMLPHEHVMSTFGAEQARYPHYDKEALFTSVLPYLKSLRKLGCDLLTDCTAAYFGRDPLILRRLSELSGIRILTNTGYYGAADDRYIPEHAYNESAEELAKRWIREWQDGIDGTGIKPGFIKIGIDGDGLSKIDGKLIDAAAHTHLATGLTIAAHTGNNTAGAYEQVRRMKKLGVHPSAWIWVHAQSVEDKQALLQSAEEGAWIEFDGVSKDSIEQNLGFVNMMKEKGYLNQTLLSHDGNSFRINGGMPKPYDALFTDFIPALQKAGYSQDEIRQLTIHNPSRAFQVQIRKTV